MSDQRNKAGGRGRKAGRRSKYGNVKTVVDGHRFDSKREAARWLELRLLERAGKISQLRRQVPYLLTIKGVKIGKYIADFSYREGCVEQPDRKTLVVGREVIEDSKGFKTATYRLKKKLMLALHGVDIREV